MSQDTDVEEEIFQLCSDQKCPRDIQFHCEILTEYATLSKQKKCMPDRCKKVVTQTLSNHHLNEFQLSLNSGTKSFHCTPCHRNCESIADCLKHILQDVHHKAEMMHEMITTSCRLPEPSTGHCVAMERCLLGIQSEKGMSSEEIERRAKLIASINTDLDSNHTGTVMEMYGCSLTGLGLCKADLNATVIFRNGQECLTTAGRTRPGRQEEDAFARTVAYFENHPQASQITISPFTDQIKILWQCSDVADDTVQLTVNRNDIHSLDLSKLLAEYASRCSWVKPLTVGLRIVAKLCEFDSPLQEGLPPSAFSIMVIHFLQQRTLLPFLDPRTREIVIDRVGIPDEKNPGELGRLWIELLKFYSRENVFKNVISLTADGCIAQETNEAKIIIEDPTSLPPNKKSKVIISHQMTSYIRDRLCAAYVYFGMPRTCRGPLYDSVVTSDSLPLCSPHTFYKSNVDNGRSNIVEPVDDPRWDIISLAEEVKAEEGKKLLEATPFVSVEARLFLDRSRWHILEEDVGLLSDLLPQWLYHYEFCKDNLQQQQNMKPPIFCKCCQSKHHYFMACPEEKPPASVDISVEVQFESMVRLNEVLQLNFEKESMTSDSYRVRQDILNLLQQKLSKTIPNAQLQIFGSSVNGFGTSGADIDICLTFDDKDDREPDTLKVMSIVNNNLYKMKQFNRIFFVRHARVPIVKFRHAMSNLEGDISCSNALAVYNSSLLRTYAEIDPRVKILGYFYKKLVKVCDISSAAKATLSSYGHTLLVIFFLQNLEVPVVPVLQELQNKPEEIVNGWNVQYFKNIENLKTVWPGYGKNRDSPAELWLKFLKFYTDEFDFENKVVSIRQKGPITRLSKFWTSESLLAVEDPFEYSHNIGSCVSRKKSIHILNTFWKFRQVFQDNYADDFLQKHKSWLCYFTDPLVIQYKVPSKARKCGVCHRMDHMTNDCPRRRKKRKIEKNVSGTKAESDDNPSKEIQAADDG